MITKIVGGTMKAIYIILSQSGTYISKILKSVTHEKYNHSSICLTEKFETFYSFGRKNPYFFIPGGFIEESPHTGVFGRFSSVPCMILKKEISEEQYQQLENLLQHFTKHQKEYSYAILSLFLVDTPLSIVKKNKFFCSQFVATLLNKIQITTPRSPEHSHPYDFIQVEGMEVIFEGDLKQIVK